MVEERKIVLKRVESLFIALSIASLSRRGNYQSYILFGYHDELKSERKIIFFMTIPEIITPPIQRLKTIELPTTEVQKPSPTLAERARKVIEEGSLLGQDQKDALQKLVSDTVGNLQDLQDQVTRHEEAQAHITSLKAAQTATEIKKHLQKLVRLKYTLHSTKANDDGSRQNVERTAESILTAITEAETAAAGSSQVALTTAIDKVTGILGLKEKIKNELQARFDQRREKLKLDLIPNRTPSLLTIEDYTDLTKETPPSFSRVGNRINKALLGQELETKAESEKKAAIAIFENPHSPIDKVVEALKVLSDQQHVFIVNSGKDTRPAAQIYNNVVAVYDLLKKGDKSPLELIQKLDNVTSLYHLRARLFRHMEDNWFAQKKKNVPTRPLAIARQLAALDNAMLSLE